MDNIHVACALDCGMTIPAMILAYSAKKFANSHRKTIFHVLECEKGAFPSYGDYLLNSEFFEIRHHLVSLNAFEDYDLSIAIVPSLAAFARLAIPDIISEAERVLYLDCDVIINRPIDALFDVDMKGFALAACRDLMYAYFMHHGEGPPQDAGKILCQDPDSYFNSGVMLIDCQKWRDAGYFASLIKVLSAPPAPLFMPDQDALNIVFKNEHLKLDSKWNVRASRYDLSKDEELEKLIIFCANDPWIIHFMGKANPWIRFHQPTEFHRLYWALTEESPFLSRLISLYETGPSENTAYALKKRAISSDRHIWEFLFTLSRATEKLEHVFRLQQNLSIRLGTLGKKFYEKYLNTAEITRS